ncbi:spore germination protein [Paenibacillus sp. HWE-109]|uniref:spore germination protein n=1 Tax=Paenibacillus sp. HWE-109 TaxID=1306526 RepID=UPI001EDFFCD4|nr:spore germination protein [Paenibacillus sp. HWE-109]UKS31195.1 spore germination protein [Paenibacillus sp. HWE-109]
MRIPLTNHLHSNLNKIKEIIGNSSDLIIKEFLIGNGSIQMAVVYTDGLADKNTLDQYVLDPLMIGIKQDAELSAELLAHPDPMKLLKETVLTVEGLVDVTDFEALILAVLSGDCVILMENRDRAMVAGTRGWEHRGVEEPSAQSLIRGPREGFTESLRINTAMIRRKIKDSRLWLESREIGSVTRTEVAVMYLKGIADDSVIEEVRQRLDRIDIDGILESGYIEEYIQDETWSPFPTLLNTERPDVIAAGLLEGRIAIIIGGTPFVLLVPALFVQYFQSAEDYYQRWDISTLIRLIRYLCFLITLILPSLYVAVTTFHQEMIPTNLLVSLMAQREGVPFPAFLEALMMEITFEILREAGVRMPRAVGSAISIVGTLVIGQAAVQAGIVSAAMVIVVSITAMASFVIPAYNMSISIRILRFPLMVLGATFGLYGIVLGIILIVLHLCSLHSFGVPYMSALAPFQLSEQKDTLFRLPRWAMVSRPYSITRKNQRSDEEEDSPTMNSFH